MHKSIEDFINNGWACEPEHYINIDVVHPEGPVQQLLFNLEAYGNFCRSLQKPNSEVKRIVWRMEKI